MTLGETIRHHREALGLSKRALGRRVGASDVAVLYWERDKHTPHPRNRRLLEQEFNLPQFVLDVEGTAAPGGMNATAPNAPTTARTNDE